MKTVTISAEPLRRAYSGAVANEIICKGKRVSRDVVRIPAVDLLRIIHRCFSQSG